MKTKLIAAALLAALPLAAQAESPWTGSGELGIAAARGNAKSENVNAKMQLKFEDALWKNMVFLGAIRSKGETSVTTIVDGGQVKVSRYDLTANRYEAGASSGYKLDERSYIVGAVRYENDDFSPFDYQAIASLGYGYTLIKNPRTELSVEAGPGYKRYRPVDSVSVGGEPPQFITTRYPSEGEAVARGLLAFKHAFNDSTSFENTLLIEAGADNQFYQNDASVSVSMTKAFALKVGYQIRHNNDVGPNVKKTDQYFVTNLVYKF